MSAAPLDPAELARAARVLHLRTRRASAGLVAGGYASAFRGGGLEFEESRPYVPGDDVRQIDWNATARSGEPFVKRFREERDQTLLLLLDCSASMGFGTAGRTKAELAALVAALLAAAAHRVRDRVGLVAFSDRVLEEVAPGRGDAHAWRLLRVAATRAGIPRGRTALDRALERVPTLARHRAIVVLLSDFRDDADLRARLLQVSRHHDLVAAVVGDPREEALPASGPIRLADPETRSRPLMLDANSRRVRALYRSAAQVRRRALERRLRTDGADVVWLRTDRDPLPPLVRFFQAHVGRVHGAGA
jgi:uncharacterized protein (DUF58 family)